MKGFVIIISGIIFLSIILMIGCCESVDTKTEGEKLMQISKEWSRVASTDSIEKILSYWADDAIVFSSGQSPIAGKQALREMVETSFKTPGFKISWEPISAYVSKSGDLGYLIERNKITVNDSLGNPIIMYGQGVTVWKRDQDGSWKNVVESIQPLPPGIE
jgi:ketosteroid isomerase-like protein